MQPQPNKYSCSVHQKYQVQMVCIQRHCDQLRLLCPQCISEETHHGHKLITLEQYYQIRQRLMKLNPSYKQAINTKIEALQKKMKTMLQQIQQTITLQFLSYDVYKKNVGQVQQVSGEISIAAKDPLFIQAFNGKKIEDLNESYKSKFISLISQIDEFEYHMVTKTHQLLGSMLKIHKIDVQASNSKIQLGQGKKIYLIKQSPSIEISPEGNIKFSEYQMVKKQEKPQKLCFSNYYKPDFFALSQDCLTITRTGKLQFGLTMYGLVNQPLTKQMNQIMFKLVKQPGHRFVYVGVCDLEKMKRNKYRGCYQLGGGMNAIRQNEPGKSGVSLHNSQKNYSDRTTVGYDFAQGDTITIYLDFDKKELNFVKNGNKQSFKMPIDTKQEWYPFVGLKYEGDSFEIVQ